MAPVCEDVLAALPHQAAWLDLGVEEYTRAYEIQLRLHALRLAGQVPDTVVLVEHPACITVGRASRLEHILASREELRAAGIAVYSTDRGGDVTYHGPGQLVLYAIVDLVGYGRDVHAHARRLEQVLIDTAASFGVTATRRKEYPGVWTDAGKIGAIGFRVKRWVTLHGVSLNVSPDLSHFSCIVPCGIRDHGVASLARMVEHRVDIAAAKSALKESFAHVFDVRLIDVRGEAPEARRHSFPWTSLSGPGAPS
jgi:lipoyl(octanoyl) transferase